MKVPTGGIVRERYAQIRCNSETNSKVWMKEDVLKIPGIIYMGSDNALLIFNT